MQLELSPADAEFRNRMRELFTTVVPQEIRDTVLEGRHLTRDQIVESQQALNAEGASLKVDGKMGPKTRSALMDYQSRNGLPASGQADSATRAKLGV